MDTWTKQNRVKRFVSAFMFSIILMAEVLSVFASGTIVSLAEDETWKEAIRERLNEQEMTWFYVKISVDDLQLDASKKQDVLAYFDELRINSGEYYWIQGVDTFGDEYIITGIYVYVKPIYRNSDNSINREQAKEDFDILQQRLDNGEWKDIIRERVDKLDITLPYMWIVIDDLKLDKPKKQELLKYFTDLRLSNGDYYWMSDFQVEVEQSAITDVVVYIKSTYTTSDNKTNREQAKKDYEILQHRLANGEWKEIVKERIDGLDKLVDGFDFKTVYINDLRLNNNKKQELLDYINELRSKYGEYYWISEISFNIEESMLTSVCVTAKQAYKNSDNSINREKAKKDFEILQQRLLNGEWREVICERIDNYSVCGIYDGYYYVKQWRKMAKQYTISLVELMDIVTKEQIDIFIHELLYDTPEYFFIKDMQYDSENLNLSIRIDVGYINTDSNINREQAIKDYFTYKERLSSLFMDFDDTMTDVEKTLAIYEWVMREAEYDYENFLNDTVPDISFTAEGVFAENKAVCSGYANAVERLLSMCGIENETASSNDMNHAWNIVKLGEYYYHVDATWDDRGRDDYGEGFFGHKNFLKSDSEFMDAGHYGWSGSTCDNEESFSEYIFRRGMSPIWYYDGFWYYINRNEICKSKIDGSNQISVKRLNQEIYNMYIYKNSMYIDTLTEIYKIDMENQSTMTLIFDTSESNIGRYIDEFVIKGDQIKIDGDEGTKIISLKPTSTIELDKTSLQLTEGECLTLKATATSDYSSKVQWASSNPLVISVDQYGNIEAKGAGEATIFASVDGVIAECKVVADKAYIYGDANGDGSISGKDVVLMKKYLAGYENLSIDLSACDVNADGDVSGKDVVKVMKYIAGYDVILGET